jgi:hypothetical protein
MPVHDWHRVPAGIFHDFYTEWIRSIKHTLNHGVLPKGYYSLVEQYGRPFGLDVLTLKDPERDEPGPPLKRRGAGTATLAQPRIKPIAQTEMEFYRTKQKMVTIRHVSDDEIVAIVEVVSRGNKDQKRRFEEFVDKAAWVLDQRIQLSIIDVFPPGRRDPNGIHAAIWEAISDGDYRLPAGKKNRTLVSYECGVLVQAYVQHFAVGERLGDMDLFLEPGGCVEVPLEETYQDAFAEVPERWRRVLAGRANGRTSH